MDFPPLGFCYLTGSDGALLLGADGALLLGVSADHSSPRLVTVASEIRLVTPLAASRIITPGA